MKRQWRAGESNGMALIAGGVLLVTMSVGGYFLGSLVDRYWHSAPAGGVTGLVLGTLIGFWDLYRIASRIMSQQPTPTQREQDAARKNWEKTDEQEGSSEDAHE